MLERRIKWIALVVGMSVLVAVPACKNKDIADANQLIQDSNAKIKQVDLIIADNEKNVRELDEADKKRDPNKVKSILDTLIKAIDSGLKLGDEAATGFEQAAKKKIDPKQVDYLKLISDSLRKKIEAFKERREAAKIMRENYDNPDQKKVKEAVDNFNRHQKSYQQLIDQANDLARKADQIATENPDMIKSK
jgi:Tfp pilus assembly protein PilP